jgi:hypothetical protein
MVDILNIQPTALPSCKASCSKSMEDFHINTEQTFSQIKPIINITPYAR